MSQAHIDYVELPSAGAHELTRAFYRKAFGWTFADYGPTYSATEGAVSVGLQGDPEEALSAPLPVVRVDDLDAAFDAVTKAGGHIAKPIFAFPAAAAFTSSIPAAMKSRSGSRPKSLRRPTADG